MALIFQANRLKTLLSWQPGTKLCDHLSTFNVCLISDKIMRIVDLKMSDETDKKARSDRYCQNYDSSVATIVFGSHRFNMGSWLRPGVDL